LPEGSRAQSVSSSHEAELRLTITEPGSVAYVAGLLRSAFFAACEDNCFELAKGAAYSFLLSLFPVLTALTSILVQVNAQSVVNVLAGFLREIVPPGTEDMILSRLRERGARPISIPVVATFLSLWAGSGAMISLMEGFQAVYRIPSGRPFLKQRSVAILLVLIAAVPAVGASSLIIFGNRIESTLLARMGRAELSLPLELAWRVARYALAFSTTTFVTGLLYYFGTSHRSEPESLRAKAGPRFWRVWPGAVVATVLWLLATTAFAWYVHHLANYNVFYGGIGTVIVLIIWLYLIACTVLIGCEFNAERERMACLDPLD
jgi:membrane protein